MQLTPNPGDEYPSYRVELQTADGDSVWSHSMLKARSSAGERVVIVNLPARLLGDGEYELTLKGVSSGRTENIGDYYFSVLKR